MSVRAGDRATSLVALIERQIECAPDAIAIACGDEQFTYREFATRAERLARRLRAAGVAHGTLVGICLERSATMLVALFATLKAGGAYVPLDPAFPRDRLAFIAADARLPLVLTERSLAPLATSIAASILCVDDDRDGPDAEVSPRSGGMPHGDDLAYVLYTSGSTGRPKGVPIAHRSLVNFLASMAREPGLHAADTLLAVTTLSFDIAGLELWLPLTVGARVAIATREESADGERLAALLARSGATLLQATPSTWRLLLAAGWAGSPVLAMLCGGEALPPDLAAELLPRGRALWNMYGPTETTIWSSLQRVRAGEPIGIGHPIDNTQFYVLAGDGTPAAPGEAGELFIGGAGVAAGYLHRPDLTAERFVPDRFRGTGTLYRTGDLVRAHAPGRLEFLGRIDQQVKIRGFRIELGEIEAALASHPAVAQAAAGVRTDAAGESALVAYVILRGGATHDDLRDHLLATLPVYMLPSRFVPLDAFPLTPNGKLDRSALPALDSGTALAPAGFAAPRNAHESAVAALFAENLGIERVGVDDSFFERGGHSLRATRLLARIAAEYGVRIALREFFGDPTVAGVARRIAHAPAAAPDREPIAARSNAAVPITPAQEALWLLDRAAAGGGLAYSLPATLRVRGALDARALQRALDALVERHAALRSTIADCDGTAVLRTGAARPVDLAVADVRSFPPTRREPEARACVSAWLQRPFDLTSDLLLRAQIVALADDDHLLSVVSHHIVTDGVSFEIILRELGDLYAAASAGGAAALAPLPVTFADAIAWQRERQTPARLDALQAYWRETLAGASGTLALPADRPAAIEPGYAGARVVEHLAPPLLGRLREVARAHDATLYMVLLACYGVLLHRYARQDDLVIGSPFAGRERTEMDGVVGYFVNTLPLRVRFADDPTFLDVLAGVREACLGAFDHQDVPFDALASGDAGLHGSPFTTLFTLEDGDNDVTAFGTLPARVLDIETGTAKFDLSLYVAERPGGARVLLEYRTARFEASTAQRMIEHFGVLAAAVAAQPAKRCSALRMLRPAERERLLHAWNATDAAYPRESTVVDLVANTIARMPDALAVTFGDARLTYRDLDVRADALAARLVAHGARPGARIGVCLERSERLSVALLAIARTGAAYVPLDPALPPARLAFIAADAELVLVVSQDGQRGLVEQIVAAAAHEPRPLARPAVVSMDAAAGVARAPSATPGASAGDIAYVLYTSGSTGRPKGVPVTHRALSNLLHSMLREPGIAAGDSMIAITTLAFDIAGVEMWLPLVAGARIVVAPRSATVDGRELAALLAVQGITLMQATPATWRLLLAGGWSGTPGLRMISCGEALVPDLARALLARGAALWNMYGPTETTVYSSLQQVLPDQPIGLGAPLANTQLYVVEPGGEPAPFGVAGELVIGGEGVAAGYLNRPELNAERFAPDAFRSAAGSRVYRSGDLACRHADGRLEYLGRIDHQVKLRGFRIELGEIESVLTAHPAIEAAAVTTRADATGERAIVAYYVMRPGMTADDEALTAHLRTLLPDYMLPARSIELAALPVTPSGKVDRNALPAPSADAARARVSRAPRSEREAAVAAIVADVLGCAPVGIDDNFFACGGHSLRAMRVLNRLATTFGVQVPLRAFFERPTVAALTAYVTSQTAAASSPDPIPRRTAGEPVPLSAAQEALWLLDRATGGGGAYHLPVAVRLRGALDGAALERALDALVERHPALRTVFASGPRETTQRATEPRPVGLVNVKAAGRDLPEREADAHERMRAFARRPFDLTRDLLLRALTVRLAPDDHVLLLVTHHIVSDGISIDRLMRDVAALYGARTNGDANAPAPPATAFTDVVAWQRSQLTRERVESLTAYWREQLAGVHAAISLPLDRARSGEPDFAGALHVDRVAPDVLERLRSLAQQHDATLYMVLLAAYATLLHRYTRQTDIVIGSPVAGRDRPEFDEIVGYFVNTLALRARFDEDATFLDVLAHIRAACLAAFDHADIPFDRLAAAGADATGPFHTLFTLEERTAVPSAFGSLAAAAVDLDPGSAKFDLSLSLAERSDGLRAAFEYRTALFEPATIARVAATFATLLESIVESPRERIASLPLLRPDEYAAAVDGPNATAAPYPRDATVPALFDAGAARTPHATALELGTARMTYGELRARADALACTLRAHGAGAGTLVGLCVERSFDMIVAVLAILKAGAAYVPIDPAYPPERVAGMLRDSRPALVLVQPPFAEMLAAAVAAACDRGSHVPRLLPLDGTPLVSAAGKPSDAAMHADAPAYVMYTSGSTGEPKGVVVSHRNIVRLVRNTTYATFGPDDVVLGFAPLAFDASTFELWGPLLNGGRIALCPPGPASLATLGRTIEGHAVTTLWLTAKLFEQLVDDDLAALRNVRHVISGGEILSPRHVRAFLDFVPGARATNGYGPTENTTFTTCFDVPADWPPASPLPIGKPIANTTAYVLDPAGRPVPVGVAGELYAGGDGVALGYLHRPKLTGERFVRDPFAHSPGARMYRTGDFARRRADGTLEFLGRMDGQLKINGVRIEPGEIEAALRGHPAVREAVVDGRPDAAGAKRLVAYLIARGGEELDLPGLRTFLAARLPRQMIPAHLIALDAFPVTPNGKLDRARLPEPATAVVPNPFVAPRTAAERVVAGLWSAALGVPRVGSDDSFFALGGHSLLAMRVISRIRDTFGTEIPLRVFFESATVAQLREALIARERKPGQVERIAELVLRVEAMPDDSLASADASRRALQPQPEVRA